MSTEADRWLRRFPAEWQRQMVAHWFAHARTQGATTPEAVIMRVGVLVGDKRAWSVTVESKQLCDNTLQALVCDRPGALAYAAQVLQATPP